MKRKNVDVEENGSDYPGPYTDDDAENVEVYSDDEEDFEDEEKKKMRMNTMNLTTMRTILTSRMKI